MNDFHVQRVSELIRGVIELLWTTPDGLIGSDVIARLPEVIQLTEDEVQSTSHSLMPRYERTVRLATLLLVKAGWLEKTNKGRWFLTEDGRDACRGFSQPLDFFLGAVQLVENDRQIAPDFHLALELIQEKAWENVIRYITTKSTLDIRQIIGHLFEAMQYHIAWIAPPQKKRGQIHLVANIDPVGANGQRILVQVKHTGQLVTIEGLKSFNSLLGSHDFGLLFSTGGFTPDSKELLNKTEYQKINAMDLEKFYEIWIRHYEKLSLDAHKLLPLKTIYVLSPPT
jgi:restriction system protein